MKYPQGDISSHRFVSFSLEVFVMKCLHGVVRGFWQDLKRVGLRFPGKTWHTYVTLDVRHSHDLSKCFIRFAINSKTIPNLNNSFCLAFAVPSQVEKTKSQDFVLRRGVQLKIISHSQPFSEMGRSKTMTDKSQIGI